MKLLEAPHRSLFFVGGVLALLALFQWAHALSARVLPALATDTLMMTMGHAFYMLYFFFAPFMFGFIFTAGPRWLSVAGPAKAVHVSLALLQLCGGVMFLSGLFPEAGLILLDGAWLIVCGQWWRFIYQSKAEDRRHAIGVAMAFSLAFSGALFGTVAWLIGSQHWWPVVAAIGMWGFLVPVFLTVSHRMVPFFTAAVVEGYHVWRPVSLLHCWWGGSLLMGCGEAFASFSLRFAGSLILTVSLVVALIRWQPWRTLGNPLLAMLHLACCWSVVGMALYLAGVLLELASVANGLAVLARHAMALGFFLCMMLGFVTRVSLGHSSRPLVVDKVVCWLYLGLHVVAAGRVLAGGPEVLAMVAVLATLILAVWLSRFIPVWWRSRVDGQPG